MLRERFGRCPPVQAVHAEHRHERFSTLNELFGTTRQKLVDSTQR